MFGVRVVVRVIVRSSDRVICRQGYFRLQIGMRRGSGAFVRAVYSCDLGFLSR